MPWTMAPPSPFRVLVVEDDPGLRQFTHEWLEDAGYETRSAENGAEALGALPWNPDLILLDLAMPGRDGVDVCREVRRTSDIPIMFLSTNGDLEDVQKAYNAGADEYLVIPYDPIVLEAKVERLASAVTQPAL